jgi:hypothetical protein
MNPPLTPPLQIDPSWPPSYAQSMKILHFLVGMLAVTLLGQAAEATVILRMDLKQLVGRSDVIFVGKVVKARSYWTPDKRHIVTDTTFQVSQGLHGRKPGSTVVVQHLGGAVGGIGMRVSGSPAFKPGEEAVLFTEKRGKARFVVGMRQGAYRVTRDSKGNVMVRANLSGLTLADKRDGNLRLIKRPSAPEHRLSDFVSKIRETLTVCAKETSRCRR